MNLAAISAELATSSRFGNDKRALEKHLGATLATLLGITPGTLNIAANQAARLAVGGANKDALEAFIILALLEPMDVEIQIGLAACASELCEHDIAIKAAATTIAIAPTDPRGYLLSGKNCLLIGRYREAREDLRDALRLAPEETTIAREAARLLTHLDTLTGGQPAE